MSMSRRRFLTATPAALAALSVSPHWLAAASATSVTRLGPPELGRSSHSLEPHEQPPARLDLGSASYLKILQITDLHFFHVGRTEDEQTLQDCQRLVEERSPHLVIVTGDAWHENLRGHDRRGLDFLVEKVSRWGVPWAFCWGNHDKLDDYQAGHDLLEKAPHCLYRGGRSHGDYRLEITANSGHPSGRPVLDLLLLNSNDQALGPWQARWLRRTCAHLKKQRNGLTPALAFFHIPLLEYESLISLKTFRGAKLESFGGNQEKGDLFPVLSEAKTIRACFCGHSHVCDYVVKTSAADLVFGRSTGYAGYGGDRLRKGAKWIEVDLSNGHYLQRSVFADGSEWII
jgi:hypothetical protein